MNESEIADSAVLDKHEQSWVAQGYKVLRRPSKATLPAFLERFSPDAILLGRKPNVVVEVVRKGQPQVERRIRELNALLAGQEDWRLEVLYAGEEPDQLPTVPVGRLRKALEDAVKLISVDQRSSLLLLWAVLEALTRRLEPEKTKRPQSPGRVVELLAGAGFVTPTEAERLREAVRWRNRLVHGDLDISPSEGQVRTLAGIVEQLVCMLERRDGNAVVS